MTEIKKGKGKRSREIKKEIVKELVEKLSSAKVIAVIDLFNLPAALLHSVRKQLRNDGDIIIRKTSLLKRALKEAKKDKLVDYIKGQKALLVSSVEPFQLYKRICSNPLKIYAKAGQVAPYDIIVPAGETMLPPGPALSELKQAKIDARIAGGKIVIGKDSVVAKQGEKIPEIVAKALQKLDIKPFELNVNVPVILEADIVYTKDVLHIDEKKFMSDLARAALNSYSLSLEIAYPTRENISELFIRAYRNARVLAIEREIITPETVDELLRKASRSATILNSKVETANATSAADAGAANNVVG